MQKSRIVRIAFVIVVLGGVYIAEQQGWVEQDAPPQPPPPTADTRPTLGSGLSAPALDTSAIDAAFAEQRSEVWLEGEGEIVHLLADDNEGSRHQRFLLDIASGLTLKISHNIDLADRVPAKKGDTVRFRGRYEWNDKGGVVHWTHHDPKGRIEGGWIEIDGKRVE